MKADKKERGERRKIPYVGGIKQNGKSEKKGRESCLQNFNVRIKRQAERGGKRNRAGT